MRYLFLADDRRAERGDPGHAGAPGDNLLDLALAVRAHELQGLTSCTFFSGLPKPVSYRPCCCIYPSGFPTNGAQGLSRCS